MPKKPIPTAESAGPSVRMSDLQHLSCPLCGGGPLGAMCSMRPDKSDPTRLTGQPLDPTPPICKACAGLAVIDAANGKPRGMPWHTFDRLPGDIELSLVDFAVAVRLSWPRFWGPRENDGDLLLKLCDTIDLLPEDIRTLIYINVVRTEWVLQMSVNEPPSRDGVAAAAGVCLLSNYVVLRHPGICQRFIHNFGSAAQQTS